MKQCMLCLLICVATNIYAQTDVQLSIEVSSDTILVDNAFKVTYSIKNLDNSSFVPEVLADFQLLQGPSKSSSVSVINGERSSEVSWTYYYRAEAPSRYQFDAFNITSGEESYESNRPIINIVENPNGLHQDPNSGRIEGQTQKRLRPKNIRRFRI